jgi:hypothetical protein
MKKHWKILGIVTLVAILGVAAIGAVALAQDSSNGSNTPFNFQQKLREAMANVLGISVDEYDSAVDTATSQVLDEAVTAGVLTQDQADQVEQRAQQGFGPGIGGGFFGRGMDAFGRGLGHGGFMWGSETSLLSVAADQIGMTVSDLTTELQSGKSIADVAADKGVDTQVIVKAFVDQLTATLNQAVTDGRITQAQADTMVQQAQERVPELLDNAYGNCMPGGGFRGGRGPHRTQPPSDDNTL